jgi:hypothetical protein
LTPFARRAAQGKAPASLSPICLDAVQRIDALSDIKRYINGPVAEARGDSRAGGVGVSGRRTASVIWRPAHEAVAR